MGLRDYLVLFLGYACVPLALSNAYYGLLAYSWLSFMRPQSLVWSMDVKAARLQFFVAIALLFRVAFTPGPKIRLRLPTVVLLVLWFWFGVSALLSRIPPYSWQPFVDFSKIALAVLLFTGLVRDRFQLKWVMVLLALCPGIWGVKFGQFFLRHPGAMTGHGGPLGQDNNDTALFIGMGIPLLVFAVVEIKNRWARWGMYGAAALAAPGIIVTGSRGGLVGMVAALAFTFARKTAIWKGVLLGTAAGFGIMALIPDQHAERYATIQEHQDDASMQGRVRAWETSMAMARAHPLTGVGYGQDVYMTVYRNYSPYPEDHPRAAHSVWFSLLGETGFGGLFIYILLVAVCLRETARVMREVKRSGGGRDHWAWSYSAGIQGALITFAVAGSLLSQARFEFVYALMMVTVPLRIIWDEERDKMDDADREAVLAMAQPARIEAPKKGYVQ